MLNACAEYVVIDDHTLGIPYGTNNMVEVVAGSVLRGGYDWKNGPVHVLDRSRLRPATKEDFDFFRVCLPPGFAG